MRTYTCMCVGKLGGAEKKKETLVRNSQWGKSLNYSLEKPAAETSTHPSEAEGCKRCLTSAPHSCQIRTHENVRAEQNELSLFLYHFDSNKALVCVNICLYESQQQSDKHATTSHKWLWWYESQLFRSFFSTNTCSTQHQMESSRFTALSMCFYKRDSSTMYQLT